MPGGQFTTAGAHLVGQCVDQNRLKLISVLGFGAYGVVYRAIDVAAAQSGKIRQYAVKCMQKAGLDTRQRQFQRREIALHQLASAHKNVVTMRRVVEEGDFIFVVLDYCEDGDLFGMITEKQRVCLKNDFQHCHLHLSLTVLLSCLTFFFFVFSVYRRRRLDQARLPTDRRRRSILPFPQYLSSRPETGKHLVQR